MCARKKSRFWITEWRDYRMFQVLCTGSTGSGGPVVWSKEDSSDLHEKIGHEYFVHLIGRVFWAFSGRHLASVGLSLVTKFLVYLTIFRENRIFFHDSTNKRKKNWKIVWPFLRNAEFKRQFFLDFWLSSLRKSPPKNPDLIVDNLPCATQFTMPSGEN